MSKTKHSENIKHHYDKEGFYLFRNFFDASEIETLKKIILKFHHLWKSENAEFYREVAFNSSLITGSKHLSTSERLVLFNFISSRKLMEIINHIIPNKPAFMNSQLFFNPINPELKDFWHRDCQYDHEIEMQKKVIQETQVVHFRIPLFDEPGMEIIPGSHRRWDTEEELAIREELNGRKSNEDIAAGKKIRLSAGDLLVFSADMIHRGIYGLDRLAWDILVFDSSGDFVDYVDDDCLPSLPMITEIEEPSIFKNTIALKSSIKT